MTKFKSVLNDDQAILDMAADCELFFPDEDIESDLVLFAKAIEQAILEKLAEQEPVAWYVNDRSITATKSVADHWSETGSIVKPLYAHPRQTPLSDQEQRIDKPMLVGNTVFTTKIKAQTVLDAAARHYNLTRTPEREAERVEIGNLKMDYWRKHNHMPSEMETLKHWIDSKEREPIGYLHANGISFLSSRRTTAEQARAEDYNTPLYAHPCVTPVSVKQACDSQNEMYETQIPDGTLIDEGTKEHHRATESHIPEGGKMAFDEEAALVLAERMISADFTEELAEDVIRFAREIRRKYAQTDHFPGVRNMIPKGFQLVPKEPTREVIRRLYKINKHLSYEGAVKLYQEVIAPN